MQNELNFSSVLDTKETFLHFSKNSAGSKQQKNDFIKAHYRYRNLYTAHILELSKYVDQETINKAIRNLRFCRSVAIVEKGPDNTAAIDTTSKTCKNPHCALCARARSTKLAIRLLSALNDPDNAKLFRSKYFYFLTLTVKHDSKTRNEIYLKEFNQYCNKLIRSKNFQRSFQISKSGKSAGWIKCTECTFSKDSFHIHAHVIICANKLKGKVYEIQQDLRETWLKITKDSYMLRLDLIKDLQTKTVNKKIEVDRNALIRTVKELLKYGTKTAKIHSKDLFRIDRLAEWIIASKGQNFVNASGIFRGLNIAGSKSKYDLKFEGNTKKENSTYYAGKLSKIKFNIPTNRNYNKEDRLKYLKEVNITALDSEFIEITDYYEDFKKYSPVGLSESDIERFIPEWMEYIKKQIESEKQLQQEVELTKSEKLAAGIRMKAQLKLSGM